MSAEEKYTHLAERMSVLETKVEALEKTDERILKEVKETNIKLSRFLNMFENKKGVVYGALFTVGLFWTVAVAVLKFFGIDMDGE